MPRSLLLICFCLSLAVGCERPLPPYARTSATNVALIREKLAAGGAGPAVEAVAAAEPTGWATLKGSFKITGSFPPPSALKVDKELDICMPGGKAVLEERLVVDPATQGIRDVLIFVSSKIPDDPKWEHESYAASKTAEVVFDQKSCIFLSHVFAMRSGQTLKILNSDNTLHNTKIEPGPGSKMLPTNVSVAAGVPAAYAPGGEGSSPASVSCSVHPWMSSWLIARNNPYFAVTKADGSFQIDNLPAGVELEFTVWQERAGNVPKTASVTGAAINLSKGRFKLKLEPDQPIDLAVTLDGSIFTK